MSETLTEVDNLSQTITASARSVVYVDVHAGALRQARQQKQFSFVEIKPLPVVKHVEI